MQGPTEERTRGLVRAAPVPAIRSRATRRKAVRSAAREEERPSPRLRAAVRNAYAMAALMKVERPVRVRTAVLQEDGTVLAAAVLRGMGPATLLRDLLLPLGFRERRVSLENPAGGYGMVLQLAADAGQARALHSGGSPVLWPLGA